MQELAPAASFLTSILSRLNKHFLRLGSDSGVHQLADGHSQHSPAPAAVLGGWIANLIRV